MVRISLSEMLDAVFLKLVFKSKKAIVSVHYTSYLFPVPPMHCVNALPASRSYPLFVSLRPNLLLGKVVTVLRTIT